MFGINDFAIEEHDTKFTLKTSLLKEIRKKIILYESRFNKDYYDKERNAKNASNNIKESKLSEFFVAYFLNERFNYPLIEPDLRILEAKDKSWDVDLPYSKIDPIYPDIANKACSYSTLKYDNGYPSWTFQYKNVYSRGGRDKLFNNLNSKEIICFSYLDNFNSDIATIYFFAPWNLIYPLLKDPVVDSLKGLKKVIYYHDLINSINIEEKEKIIYPQRIRNKS